FHGLLAGAARHHPGDPGHGPSHRDRGHGPAALGAREKAGASMNLLQTEKLSKSFGDTHAVDNVDFTIGEGEVLALIGSNGAGKTSLVNLISGLIRADTGQIVFRGADVTSQSVHDRIKAGIARSFQLVNLFDQLTLLDNVALSIFSREGKTRKLFSLANRQRAVWDEAFDVLRQFGLDAKANV